MLQQKFFFSIQTQNILDYLYFSSITDMQIFYLDVVFKV